MQEVPEGDNQRPLHEAIISLLVELLKQFLVQCFSFRQHVFFVIFYSTTIFLFSSMGERDVAQR